MKFTYTSEGLTGLNRSAIEGESEGTCTPQELVWGMDIEMYIVVNAKLVPKAASAVEAVKAKREWEIGQKVKELEIRAAYEVASEAPVEVTVDEGTFTFNGGQDSASWISGAIDLAVGLGETEVQIWDIDNVIHTFSFESATAIAGTIGYAFRAAAFEKQNALVALAAEEFVQE